MEEKLRLTIFIMAVMLVREVGACALSKDPLLSSLGVMVCDDNTISFKQPPSPDEWGYEGKCGQTAAANVLAAYCKNYFHPHNDLNRYFSDITPGVNPQSLRLGLNQLFYNLPSCPRDFSWSTHNYRSEKYFLLGLSNGLQLKLGNNYIRERLREDGSKVRRTPVIVLESSDGKTLHWVTIVDMIKTHDKCQVIINDHGRQRKDSCEKQAARAKKVEEVLGGIFHPYKLIKLKQNN
jgi:hypothetical protein